MNDTADVQSLYIDLLKHSLTGANHEATYVSIGRSGPAGGRARALLRSVLRMRSVDLVRKATDDEMQNGRAWPLTAETMVGHARLSNVEASIRTVIDDDVPGDVIEAGVWRGGSVILMRGIFKARNVTNRKVVVADSFEGLPPPDLELHPEDEGIALHTFSDTLAVDLSTVRANFRRYGLLDDQVEFVQGWFRDTLPKLADRKWSVIRLDGDMYGSTIDGLRNLYPGLAVGGFLIIDDYGASPPCAKAVDDYRTAEGITEKMERVDWSGVYWRRER